MPHGIGEVEDIDDANEARLVERGIRTTDDLLARCATPAARSALAAELAMEPAELLRWANCADLMRIAGVGTQFADLLEEAGVDTVPELAQRNAANLHTRVVELNEARGLAGRAPTAAELASWIEQARGLPRMLRYNDDPDGLNGPPPAPEEVAAARPQSDAEIVAALTVAPEPEPAAASAPPAADAPAAVAPAPPPAHGHAHAHGSHVHAEPAVGRRGLFERLAGRLRGQG